MLKLNNNIKSVKNVFVGSSNESVISPKEYRVYFIAEVTYTNNYIAHEEIGFYDFKNKYGMLKNIFAAEKEYKNYKSMLNYVYNNIDSMACIDTKIQSNVMNTAKELIKAEDKALELKETENNNIEVVKVETVKVPQTLQTENANQSITETINNKEVETMKEVWEMTYNQYCEYILNNCKYADRYRKNPIVWENKKKDLLNDWFQLLQDRAEIGDIPEIVIRSLVKEVGESRVRRIFRGTKEKGLQSWEQTQINKMHREPVKENLHRYEENLKKSKQAENNTMNSTITEATTDQAQTPETETIKLSITEGFTTLKEADKVQIIGKIELHTSYISNETYNMVTDIKIIKDSNIIYEAYRIDFPVNSEGKISIVNYLDDIILYINNTTLESYWLNIQLDKLFKEKNTTRFEIAVKQLKNSITEENRIKEGQQREKEIQELKANIITLANNKNMLVAIGSENIRLLKDLQQRQASKDFIKMILNMDINDKMIKPHLVKSFEAGDTVGLTYSEINKRLLLETKEYLDAM